VGLLAAAAVVAILLVWGIASAFGGVGVSLPTKLAVPNLVDKPLPAARDVLRAEHFKVSVHRVDAANAKPGVVLHQSPRPGAEARIGGVVTLRVASGNVAVDLNRYVGKRAPAVLDALRALGLKPSRTDVASAFPAGTVIAVSPAGEVPVGSPVTVSVAAPIPPAVTPPGKAKPPDHHGPGPGHGHGHDG
jgi:serine/threonine-protein kinase